jgi:hypothetical protein
MKLKEFFIWMLYIAGTCVILVTCPLLLVPIIVFLLFYAMLRR